MARICTDVNTYGFHCGTIDRVATEQTQKQTPFGSALQRLIAEHGWSQRRIARAMGTSHTQVGRYIYDAQDPGFSHVIRLAEKAGVSLDWLAGRSTRLPRVIVDDVPYVPDVDAPPE